MDSTNKVLALFVGLFVVILTIGIGMSRITKNNKSLSGAIGSIFSSKKSLTPTPTIRVNAIRKNNIVIRTNPAVNNTTKTITRPVTGIPQAPTEIPQTGAETIPIIAISLVSGIIALKKSYR